MSQLIKSALRILLLPLLIIAFIPASGYCRTLFVGAYENAPKIYRDQAGHASGFWIEPLETIAKEEKWNIQYQWGSWKENLAKLETGEIDLLPDVAVTAERKQRFVFSEQMVLLSWSGLYQKTSTPLINSIFDLNGKTIAVLSGSVNYKGQEGIKELVEKFDIDCNFAEYSSYSAAFRAVQSGYADIAVTNKNFGNSHKHKYSLQATPFIFKPTDLKFAFSYRNPDRSQLMAIIDRHLRSYKSNPESIYYQLLNKYFNEKVPADRFVMPAYINYLIASLVFCITITIIATVVYHFKLRQAKEKISLNLEQLKAQQHKYKLLLNNQLDGIFVRPFHGSAATVFIEVNDAAVDMYGYSRAELETLSPNELRLKIRQLPPQDHELSLSQPIVYEALDRKKNGEAFPVEVSSTVITLEQEQYVLSTVRDISRRKQLEATHQEYLDMLQSIAQQLPGLIYKMTLTPEGKFSIPYISQAVEQLFGVSVEDAQKTPSLLFERIHRDDISHLYQAIKESARTLIPWSQRFRIIGTDSQTHWLYTNCTPRLEGDNTSWYGFSADITDQIKTTEEHIELEKQLQQKHKMEAIGVMAGGIAHNFNNSLTLILGNLELAQRRISNPQKCQQHLANAKTALLRSRDLIKQIMLFSRSGDHHLEQVSLMDVINETLTLMRSTIPSSIKLEEDWQEAPQNTMTLADRGQIQDALVNLCNNAVQAMEQKGVLSIHLKQVTLPEASDNNDYVCITISDTGCGIPKEMQEKIFDPFFTTKEVGQGTGMGLATVRGIIEAHQGFIKVDSTMKRGTSFHLYLPQIKQTHTDYPAQIQQTSKGHGESILLVDDDAEVGQTTCELLEELGYRVNTFTDSRAALTELKKGANHYQLVITDQVMPHLIGSELISQAKSLQPDLPFILMTGCDQIDDENIGHSAPDSICHKPLDIKELAQAISSCLKQQRKKHQGRGEVIPLPKRN